MPAFPIIPVAISGTEKVLSAIKRFQRAKVTLSFGEPIIAKKEDIKKLNELTAQTMEAIKKMLPEQYC